MGLALDERGVIVTCPTCRRSNRVGYTRIHASVRCAQCKTVLPPIDAPADVGSTAQFDAAVAQSSVPVLVDFWAEWCGPCRMVAPEVAKVASNLRGRMLALKVDTERLPDLAARFRVQSIPTLAVFRHGQLAERTAGALPAHSIEQLVNGSENV